MTTAEGCQKRCERLWTHLRELSELTRKPTPEVALISDPASLIYFAGYEPSPFEFRSVNASALLLLTPDGRRTLVADNVVEPYVQKSAATDSILPVWYRCIEAAPHRKRLVADHAVAELRKLNPKTVAIESSTAPAVVIRSVGSERSAPAFENIDPTVHHMRRSKDPDEVAVLRRAMKAGDAGHAAAMRELKPGMSEVDAWLTVQNAAIRSVGEPARVYGDFASGPRCEGGGGAPTDRKIEAGDLFLLDYSVVVGGYRGDFANTFIVAGKPSDEQRRFFDACRSAMEAGEGKLKAGTLCKDVDAAVRAVFQKLGLLDRFTHHSGHGLGLGHPEPPYFVPESDETLLAGDVVTLEPGLYQPGVGGMRFERNYLITETGFEVLSGHEISL